MLLVVQYCGIYNTAQVTEKLIFAGNLRGYLDALAGVGTLVDNQL